LILYCAELLYISVHYHIIDYVHKHENNLEEVKSKMGYRRRAYFGQWPGRGPFSYLPPWQRPGWVYGGRGYGRGWGGDPRVCARFPSLPRWWWADPTYAYQPLIVTPAPEDELAALEESKKALGEEKASIEQEITEIETQVKELKSKLEAEKKPPTGQ
jgi:hypothetical protein